MNYEQDATFMAGEVVRIKAGPFSGFTGKVEAIGEDQRKLKVAVGIFGQRPAIELFFLDVERVGATDQRKN